MNFQNKYSASERLLHNLAFTSWPALTALSGMESRAYRRELAGIKVEEPVFITALPRAGTTLLLELCVRSNDFASHLYRDMPFLALPLFWNRYARLFKGSADLTQERAHGDGMTINVDSPEALEEIIWKGFWRSRYKTDRIVPWRASRNPEFESFFRDHMRKIIYLRSKDDESQRRYISKNNLNIARIGYLKTVFPGATVIIPFRDPLQHASSLLRQHLNFLKMHGADTFARKYMEDIGHFDFGKNLKPVDFDNWFSGKKAADTETMLFWLQYWIAAYGFLLENNREDVRFLCFEGLCENPENSLAQLADILELANPEGLTAAAGKIGAPKPYPIPENENISETLGRANALYAELVKVSL